MSTSSFDGGELELLTEEERRALRASRFAANQKAAVQARPAAKPVRLAHPGGPVVTNKAAALAKFLKRKIAAEGAGALDPTLVEQAVRAAQARPKHGRLVNLTSPRAPEVYDEPQSDEEEQSKTQYSKGKKGKRRRKVLEVNEDQGALGQDQSRRFMLSGNEMKRTTVQGRMIPLAEDSFNQTPHQKKKRNRKKKFN